MAPDGKCPVCYAYHRSPPQKCMNSASLDWGEKILSDEQDTWHGGKSLKRYEAMKTYFEGFRKDSFKWKT